MVKYLLVLLAIVGFVGCSTPSREGRCERKGQANFAHQGPMRGQEMGFRGQGRGPMGRMGKGEFRGPERPVSGPMGHQERKGKDKCICSST